MMMKKWIVALCVGLLMGASCASAQEVPQGVTPYVRVEEIPMTQADEAYVKTAYDAIEWYLDDTIAPEADVKKYPSLAERFVLEIDPQDGSGLIYRVEFALDGVRRVQRVYTGIDDFWSEGMPETEKWLDTWGYGWINDPELRATDGRLLEMADAARTFAREKGIDCNEWTGIGYLSMLLLPGVEIEEGRNTDIYFVFQYPVVEGNTDLLHGGASIDVGYSLYQNQISFIDFRPDSNG